MTPPNSTGQEPEIVWEARDDLANFKTLDVGRVAHALNVVEAYQAGRALAKSELAEIEQLLGGALGYPWFKDDPKNFPGATEADGVCVGDHVAVTLAMEAAQRIAGLQATLARPDSGDGADLDKAIMEAAQAAWVDDTEPFEYEGRQLTKITVDRGNLRFAFSQGAHWMAGTAWAQTSLGHQLPAPPLPRGETQAPDLIARFHDALGRQGIYPDCPAYDDPMKALREALAARPVLPEQGGE